MQNRAKDKQQAKVRKRVYCNARVVQKVSTLFKKKISNWNEKGLCLRFAFAPPPCPWLSSSYCSNVTTVNTNEIFAGHRILPTVTVATWQNYRIFLKVGCGRHYFFDMSAERGRERDGADSKLHRRHMSWSRTSLLAHFSCPPPYFSANLYKQVLLSHLILSLLRKVGHTYLHIHTQMDEHSFPAGSKLTATP